MKRHALICSFAHNKREFFLRSLLLSYCGQKTLYSELSLRLKCWCYALYLLHKLANNHESRFNLLGLLNQQSLTCMSVAGLERMTTGSVAKHLNLSATQVDGNVDHCHFALIKIVPREVTKIVIDRQLSDNLSS